MAKSVNTEGGGGIGLKLEIISKLMFGSHAYNI